MQVRYSGRLKTHTLTPLPESYVCTRGTHRYGLGSTQSRHNNTRNPHQQSSGASGSIYPPTTSFPLGTTWNYSATSSKQLKSARHVPQPKPHNEVVNHPAHTSHPPTCPKRAAQGVFWDLASHLIIRTLLVFTLFLPFFS